MSSALELGEELKRCMHEGGLYQGELSREAKISGTFLHDIFNGRRPAPISLLLSMSALGCISPGGVVWFAMWQKLLNVEAALRRAVADSKVDEKFIPEMERCLEECYLLLKKHNREAEKTLSDYFEDVT